MSLEKLIPADYDREERNRLTDEVGRFFLIQNR